MWEEATERLATMRRGAKFLMNRELATAWMTWDAYLEESAQARASLRHSMGFLLNREQRDRSRGFNAWVEATDAAHEAAAAKRARAAAEHAAREEEARAHREALATIKILQEELSNADAQAYTMVLSAEAQLDLLRGDADRLRAEAAEAFARAVAAEAQERALRAARPKPEIKPPPEREPITFDKNADKLARPTAASRAAAANASQKPAEERAVVVSERVGRLPGSPPLNKFPVRSNSSGSKKK